LTKRRTLRKKMRVKRKLSGKDARKIEKKGSGRASLRGEGVSGRELGRAVSYGKGNLGKRSLKKADISHSKEPSWTKELDVKTCSVL